MIAIFQVECFNFLAKKNVFDKQSQLMIMIAITKFYEMKFFKILLFFLSQYVLYLKTNAKVNNFKRKESQPDTV